MPSIAADDPGLSLGARKMAQVEFAVIKKLVAEAADKAAIGKAVDRIELEADHDEGGSDFLRITLYLKELEKIENKQLVKVIESVEDALLDKDERFPSVRFAEAA
jgi:hypothetical protein